MYRPAKKKIAIFSSLFFVFFAIFFLNLSKIENPITGYVVQESDAGALMIIIILVAIVSGGLMFLLIYKRTRYFL